MNEQLKTVSAMNKLYIGNLPTEADEEAVRQLFAEQNLTVAEISVKRGGYAFVDFPDQSTADRAIDKLHGYSYCGLSLIVEPSVANKKIVNMPNLQSASSVQLKETSAESSVTGAGGGGGGWRAINGLNGCEVEGGRMKVEAAEGMARGGRRGRPGGGRGGGGAPGSGARPTDFPLRLLVQSDMVGAIIGRQGSTIRLITQQSRARVDVHRKDNVGSLEKAITIYGNPDNCTNACKRILEVMQQEANNTNKGEICLKILAHNNLIGRIIGKGGNTIKRIMQETDTKITVSSINDINSFNLERIITVKGSIENMAKAESQISAKLRQSYENDLQVLAPQSIMFPGLHPMAMMSTGRGFCGAPPPFPPPIYAPLAGQGGAQQGAGDSQETTYLYIPNNAVGAIIGTKGSHIRNIIRFSNASVKIAPLEQEKGAEAAAAAGAGAANAAAQQERKVTIVGSPEAQWKAQYLIYEKMREEGFMSGSDDVRLTVEIVVASSQVGRIIGKGGQNVRELQRVTGSLIKLPEQPQPPAAAAHDHETTVHIVGPFYSVQRSPDAG
ncbi:insulin-like growth factor 2 mRNA-binding protein 3 isoform X2 [Maniola jurtina]|uniref:insulin-like growth factor 2 mRNA-binding protein 3 isoform X2 n=1 Tax=Maniola jurtina TaxID=191418 RepID=UPI001E686444|nr:insulin-like growth factor 2 mRNA-binding protein 3 isoform X2 [Maniola jurtina]